MCNVAPVDAASRVACSTATAAVSEPSVPTMMTSYIRLIVLQLRPCHHRFYVPVLDSLHEQESVGERSESATHRRSHNEEPHPSDRVAADDQGRSEAAGRVDRCAGERDANEMDHRERHLYR